MPKPAELPSFISDNDVIISSSYRKHLTDVKEASLRFFQLGLEAYPNHNQEEAMLDGGFIFLGGGQHKHSKSEIQRSFFQAIKRAKLLYVVTSNGYLGQTASIETSYGLATGTPTVLSESIKDFGEGVPNPVIEILESLTIPIVPIEEIPTLSKNGNINSEHLANSISLSERQRKDLFFSILSLMRQLR